MNGVMLDTDSLGSDINLDDLKALPIEWRCYGNTLPAETASRIADADIVLTNKVVINAEAMQQAKSLAFIGVLATGTNVIDLQSASERNITVCNVRGYGTASVVQHTWALILALTTKLNHYQRAAIDGRWGNSPFFCLLDQPVHELEGKTLAIVGYGELGRGVAQIGEAFGMNIVAWQQPNRQYSDTVARLPLTALLQTADVISIHCPLTDETANLFSHTELALMKPTAILVNTARGGIVNELALVNAIDQQLIAGAATDVVTTEPPANGNMLFKISADNLIITPHCAWASVESRQRLVNQMVNVVKAFLAGKAINKVN